MSVIAIDHVSLDGVLQGPGRADEDDRDGFVHGGWSQATADPSMGAAMSRRMGTEFSWLFGRRSYDDLLRHWNEVGGPLADGLDSAAKYVASTRPDTALRWPNSTLLTGDVPAAVGRLKQESRHDLVIMGSGALIQALQPHGLIDEFLLFVHPIVLGSGRRLFGHDRVARRYSLVESDVSEAGVITAVYRLRREERAPGGTRPADLG